MLSNWAWKSVLAGIICAYLGNMLISSDNTQYFILLLVSSLLTLQGAFTLIWMLYAWEDPNTASTYKSPTVFAPPQLSFTALIPARHEEKVIKDTIRAVDRISYPCALTEILILCRLDDVGTITKAREAIAELGKDNIHLVIFDSYPINKPHGLNEGLKVARNQIVTIFDAEDEPHPDVYNIVNTVITQDRVDVVQLGVQLMNYRSNWFSALNVMEYFLWFKSGLQFFLRLGHISPLGGNTVFFKKTKLDQVAGWDESCLTEDCDIAVRLALIGAKIRVIYDEKHVTREETPVSITSFIKQRTRWNQGFLQILTKQDWRKLPDLRQKLVIVYVILSPVLQSILFIYLPISAWIAFTQKLPLLVALFSYVPLYLFLLQVLVYVIGLYEFTRSYHLQFPFWMPLKIICVFYPYQIMLIFSSIRAVYRSLLNNNAWEKTVHLNNHRNMEINLYTTPLIAQP